jgi:hypothetical protein
VWPEYNLHGNDSGTYFGALFPQYAYLQILFFDRETEQVVARGRTIPFRWDGSLEGLPKEIDALGLRAIESPQAPTALSAAAEEAIDRQGLGLSRAVLQAMAALARQADLSALVAPVRPDWKDRYPLIPIERYAYWGAMVCLSTRGSECTPDWVRPFSGQNRSPCGSMAPLAIGTAGLT